MKIYGNRYLKASNLKYTTSSSTLEFNSPSESVATWPFGGEGKGLCMGLRKCKIINIINARKICNQNNVA